MKMRCSQEVIIHGSTSSSLTALHFSLNNMEIDGLSCKSLFLFPFFDLSMSYAVTS